MLRLPVRYPVTIGVIVVPILATLLFRWADVDEGDLSYGLPALEAGRWWTLLTGMLVVEGLAIPLPSFTAIAVVLHEHVAGSWRALVALVGGQVLGVLLVLVAIIPLRDDTGAFAQEVTNALDVGISVGGFACMGAWTASLRAGLRRPIRWGESCYQLGPLLFSGLIYDLTHPVGWFLGLLGGSWLMRPRRLDRRPLRRRDVAWIGLGIAIGTAIGVYAGWNGGGIGGIFGWGPE